MALIRCPNCDTLHDLEGSFFASGPRKVRCASCRTIWEAVDPESSITQRPVAPKFDSEPRPAEVAAPEMDEMEAALGQDAIDAMDFSVPEPPAKVEPVQDNADISASELEALFAEPAPAAATETDKAGKSDKDPIEFDPASLARAQDEATADDIEPQERRRNRRAKHLAANDAHLGRNAKPKGSSKVTVMLMAAGIGTLATLGLLRNEAVRLFPGVAPVFEAVGLGVSIGNLDIAEVRSRLVREEGRETLEVTGTIANLARATQKLPVMRLSIRSNTGQEIYVWTAAADVHELAPGEKTVFRRRLASPPAESHSVMVRFVAKDDIVAAIR